MLYLTGQLTSQNNWLVNWLVNRRSSQSCQFPALPHTGRSIKDALCRGHNTRGDAPLSPHGTHNTTLHFRADEDSVKIHCYNFALRIRCGPWNKNSIATRKDIESWPYRWHNYWGAARPEGHSDLQLLRWPSTTPNPFLRTPIYSALSGFWMIRRPIPKKKLSWKLSWDPILILWHVQTTNFSTFS